MFKKLLFSATLILGITANAQLVDGNTFVSDNIIYQVKAGATEVLVSEPATPTHGDTAGTEFDYTQSSITIPDTVTIGSQTFAVTEAGPRFLEGNFTVTSVTIGNNVTLLSLSSFRNTSITGELVIPDNVVTIANQVFRNSPLITNIAFSGTSQLESVGVNSFRQLTGVSSLFFPEGLTTVGGFAFHSNPNLSLTFAGPEVMEGNVFGPDAVSTTAVLTVKPEHLASYEADIDVVAYYGTNIVASATLSSDEVSANDFNVFIDNTDVLNINGAEYTDLSVYNISGAKVATSTDVSALSTGLYLAVISTDKGSVVKKFVK